MTHPKVELTDDEWLRVLDITLNGTFRCTRAALRQLVAQGHGGAVVNNASVLGWRAQEGQAHYAAAKAGVMALTRCAALDVASHGIRVNAISPGAMDHGEGGRAAALGLTPEEYAEFVKMLIARIPLGRKADSREVAACVLFLCSAMAAVVTGHVLHCDGGETV